MNLDAFRTIAEISVALAGFIGIILVLQHRDRAFIQIGMITIFGTSFGAMMFALAPDFLSRLLSTDTMWRVSCGTFGLYHLFLIVNHQARQRSTNRKSLTSTRSPDDINNRVASLSYYLLGYARRRFG